MCADSTLCSKQRGNESLISAKDLRLCSVFSAQSCLAHTHSSVQKTRHRGPVNSYYANKMKTLGQISIHTHTLLLHFQKIRINLILCSFKNVLAPKSLLQSFFFFFLAFKNFLFYVTKRFNFTKFGPVPVKIRFIMVACLVGFCLLVLNL